ncbi:MAG: hypothetical protein IH608_01010, partial [Proteobacteria bacterium]|nr:hypothetical protein [Pseudomonadota bacterium]
MLSRVVRSAYLFLAARRQAPVPFADEKAWRALQGRRVQATVAHAFASVPFYRSFMLREGLRPEHFRSAGDLRAFPLLSKAEVARAPDEFLSNRQYRGKCLELRTSGTTGRPGSFWHDPGSLLANLVYGERERQVIPPRAPGGWGCE